MRDRCTADVLIQPKGIPTSRRSARSVLASIVCFPSPKSPSSRLGANGWDSTGRMRKIRCVQLCHLCPCVAILTSNQLFARHGRLPNQTSDPWTVFEMKLREPAPIPAVFDFTRFLVSSITFKTHLREVVVYFDNKQIVRLSKAAGIPKQLTTPRGLKPTSVTGFMNIKALKATCRWPTDSEVCSTLKIVTHYSPAYHCGSYGLCL